MANLKYSADLIDYILFRSGEKTDGTSDFNDQALIYLNAAYRKIWQGGGEFDPSINEDWVWLRDEGNLIMQTKIDTGTISVINDSATATLSSAPLTTDLDGWFLKTDDHKGIFVVSAHSAGDNSIILDSVYTGDTNATASYKLVKLDYTLASDAIEVLSPMKTAHRGVDWGWVGGVNRNINGVSIQSIPWNYDLRAGVPLVFSQISSTAIRFDRYADDDLIRIDYWYKNRPNDLTDSGTEEPLVPLHHRHVMANIALFDIWTDKNDDRADMFSLIAKQGLKAMSIENQSRLSQMDEGYGRIRPRTDFYSYPHGYRYIGEPYE